MTAPDHQQDLQAMRQYFQTGVTRSYDWRRQQLLLLKEAVTGYEQDIAAALYADLKKSPEEAYGTETGLLLAEITTAVKNLRSWMRPRRARTNLLNLPSTSKIYRDPLGVVLIIAPWNYPFQLSLIPLVGAIAGGNCSVVKPSELAPATATIVEKILTGIFAPEFVRVMQGEGSVVLPSLISSFRFDHIFFTGSIPVGRAIYQLAAKELVPVTLELGGKSPGVVENDAQIRTAAKRIAFAKFTNAGQTCIAPDYLLLHADIKDRFLGELREAIRQFYGEQEDRSDDYGRIINEKHFDRLISYLPQGKILFGGRYQRSELFLSPTIMDQVGLDTPLMKEEIFGPLLPVFTYHTMEEAMAVIRRNPDPLAFYLFTGDAEKEKAWMGKLSFGGGCVNNAEWHFANHHLPFGGIGYSGMGAYHGKYSFDSFTHAKPVMKTPVWIDPSIKYPPFKGKMKWFKLFIR
ncbi:MAG TPA: aldehyde dehydrogenase [Puia sp.]|nr:aldehyde dehydrogenase [Puia sp.]